MTEMLEGVDLFEWGGLISGLLCVVLLIKRNIWTWPIGLFYALVSLAVFAKAKLYSEVALHVYYAGMSIYGWYFWSRKGKGSSGGEGKVESVPVGRTSWRTGAILLSICLPAVIVLALLMQRFTEADMVWADSSITVLSLAAMWMTARKLIENWMVWLAVDVLATTVYLKKGINLYALLYFVYTGMAIAGWIAWKKDLHPTNN